MVCMVVISVTYLNEQCKDDIATPWWDKNPMMESPFCSRVNLFWMKVACKHPKSKRENSKNCSAPVHVPSGHVVLHSEVS